MHALIFWGFVVLMLQVVQLYGRAFDADWSLPGSATAARPAVRGRARRRRGVVIVAVVYMLYRRLIAHTPRLFGLRRAEQRYRDTPHWEGSRSSC